MDEEKTISLKDIIKVLLGNKWIYLIMLCSFFVVSMVGFSIYSSASKNYVAFFDYDVAGFAQDETQCSFIDGEKFDLRSLITKEKVTSYIEGNETLSGLNGESLLKRGAIKSLNYVIKYKDNDHKMNDSDAAFIENKSGFELVLDMDCFSQEQAQCFSEIIANQVIELSKEKVNNISYRSYLNYYDKANSYFDKVTYLTDGIKHINDLSTELETTFGDLVIPNGKYGGEEDKYSINSIRISDWRDSVNICFNGYFVDTLKQELEVGGFIDKNSDEYIASIKTNIDNINREIAVNESVLSELKTQRDALVTLITSSSSVMNMEIGEYNSEIIGLTKKIADQKEQVAKYELQLSKLDLSILTPEQIEAYNNALTKFEGKLATIRENLGFYTMQYEAIAKKIITDNMSVYFESPDVVSLSGGLSNLKMVVFSGCISVFVPMIVNLALAFFKVAEGKNFLRRKQKENE